MLESLRECYAAGEEPQRVLALQGAALAALGRFDDAADAYRLAVAREQPTAELCCQLAEVEIRATWAISPCAGWLIGVCTNAG